MKRARTITAYLLIWLACLVVIDSAHAQQLTQAQRVNTVCAAFTSFAAVHEATGDSDRQRFRLAAIHYAEQLPRHARDLATMLIADIATDPYSQIYATANRCARWAG